MSSGVPIRLGHGHGTIAAAFAGMAGRFQLLQVFHPQLGLVGARPVPEITGKHADRVAVGETWLDGVIADRVQRFNGDVAFFGVGLPPSAISREGRPGFISHFAHTTAAGRPRPQCRGWPGSSGSPITAPETGSHQTRWSCTSITPGVLRAATHSASRSRSSRMVPYRCTTPFCTT